MVSFGSTAFLNLAMASCCLFGLAARPLNSSNCISYPLLGLREIAVLKSCTFWEAKSFTCWVSDAWAVKALEDSGLGLAESVNLSLGIYPYMLGTFGVCQ